MVDSRTATAAVGILGSLVASAVLWWYFNTFVFFLLVPFVPFVFRSVGRESTPNPVRTCPTCGYRTGERSHEFCPRDGTRLEEWPR